MDKFPNRNAYKANIRSRKRQKRRTTVKSEDRSDVTACSTKQCQPKNTKPVRKKLRKVWRPVKRDIAMQEAGSINTQENSVPPTSRKFEKPKKLPEKISSKGRSQQKRHRSQTHKSIKPNLNPQQTDKKKRSKQKKKASSKKSEGTFTSGGPWRKLVSAVQTLCNTQLQPKTNKRRSKGAKEYIVRKPTGRMTGKSTFQLFNGKKFQVKKFRVVAASRRDKPKKKRSKGRRAYQRRKEKRAASQLAVRRFMEKQKIGLDLHTPTAEEKLLQELARSSEKHKEELKKKVTSTATTAKPHINFVALPKTDVAIALEISTMVDEFMKMSLNVQESKDKIRQILSLYFRNNQVSIRSILSRDAKLKLDAFIAASAEKYLCENYKSLVTAVKQDLEDLRLYNLYVSQVAKRLAQIEIDSLPVSREDRINNLIREQANTINNLELHIKYSGYPPVKRARDSTDEGDTVSKYTKH